MSDRYSLVTGVTSGVGKSVAVRLLNEGHRVIGVARNCVKTELSHNANLSIEKIDLSDLSSLATKLPALAEKYTKISSVVFCAGYGQFGNLEEFSYEEIAKLINTNLTAQIFVARTFLPKMKRNNSGNLVFISSEAILSGGRRGAVYSASKAGISMLATSLRRECSRNGVKVSVIVPGMVRTAFYDNAMFTHGDHSDNFVEANEVADAVSLILNSRGGAVFEKVVLTPLKSVIKRQQKN